MDDAHASLYGLRMKRGMKIALHLHSGLRLKARIRDLETATLNTKAYVLLLAV